MRTIGISILSATLLTAALLTAAIGCSAAGEEDAADTSTQNATAKVKGVTKDDRQRYLARAQIWSEEDFNALDRKDLLAGPGGEDAFVATRNADGTATFPQITCQFVEPERVNELGGKSPKFQCGKCTGADKAGCNVDKTLKVKFGKGADDNGEVYAEVIATRLLWALGYKVDAVYPVRVTCKNCPDDPWKIYKDFTPGAGARAERQYTAALIERKYEGPKIEEKSWPEEKDGQGWSFDEVERARQRMPEGGAPTDHWSALKLLAAFIKHADNKAANQRLVCLPDAVTEDGKCNAPFLMIQDMGATFGGGGQLFGSIGADSKARYDEWSGTKVWKYRSSCTASLFSFWYSEPVVTNSGRAFLANLLSKITDKHLRDIFTASRIVERGETLKENGQRRPVTVDDWIKAFNEKKAELNQPCGADR